MATSSCCAVEEENAEQKTEPPPWCCNYDGVLVVTSEPWWENTSSSGFLLRVRCAYLLLQEHLQARMRLTKSGICMTLGHIWEKKTKYVTTWLCSSKKKSWWFTLSFVFIWGLECTTRSLVGLQAGHLIQHLFCPLSFCLQKQSSDYIQLFCILLPVIFYQFSTLLS